jgi:hypothetical protein
MRLATPLLLTLASACGSAAAPGSATDTSDAPPALAATTPTSGDTGAPLVGTLRMRDRSIPLTVETLEARGNESLRDMTAQQGVMADIDPHVGEEPQLREISADLDLL